MRNYILSFIIFILCAGSVSGQIIVPSKREVKDKKLQSQYQQTVKNIDSMPLRCDTLHYKSLEKYNPLYLLEVAYFDALGQLRKYLWKDACNDGASDAITILTYYNKGGELFYINVVGSNHCTDTNELYYLHNGCIADFKVVFDCGCCDGEDMFTKESIDKMRPVIGSVLTETIEGNLSLLNFIHADTLLTRIKSKDYNGNGWAQLSSFDLFER